MPKYDHLLTPHPLSVEGEERDGIVIPLMPKNVTLKSSVVR